MVQDNKLVLKENELHHVQRGLNQKIEIVYVEGGFTGENCSRQGAESRYLSFSASAV